MNRFLRYLRIAFSAGCGLACVLLVVLWVRSYKLGDLLLVRISTSRTFNATSLHGWTKVSTCPPGTEGSWKLFSQPANEAMRTYGEFFEAKQNFLGFGTHKARGTYAVIVPYQFLILAMGTMVVVPWLPRRFSLRTMLIATTLAAVVLGLTMWAVR